MFQDCNNLVGGQSTTYDPNHTEEEYAHLDGGPDNPGYFSEKSAFIRGDVNGDGIVNISDVTALINLLMADGEMPAAADFNADGVTNISDVTSLITYLMGGESSGAAPCPLIPLLI